MLGGEPRRKLLEKPEVGKERLRDAMSARLRRLMRAPAPDVAALAVKLDLYAGHEMFTLDGGEAAFGAVRRDARRLSGGA